METRVATRHREALPLYGMQSEVHAQRYVAAACAPHRSQFRCVLVVSFLSRARAKVVRAVQH